MAKEKDASARRKQAVAADARAEGRTDAALAQKVKSGPARRRGRRKRVRLGDAMRRVGLDERAIAENYAGVVEKLTNGQQQPNDGAEKLLVEVLKECTRVLEPPLRAGGAAPDAPVTVQLIHNVPRPRREAASAVSRVEAGAAQEQERI